MKLKYSLYILVLVCVVFALNVQCTCFRKKNSSETITMFFQGFYKDKITVYINGVLAFHSDSLVSRCGFFDYKMVRVPVILRSNYEYTIVYNERYSKFDHSNHEKYPLPHSVDRTRRFIVNHAKHGFNIQFYFYPPFSERKYTRLIMKGEDWRGFEDVKYTTSKKISDYICTE